MNDSIRATLELAVEGLVFSSESDRPITIVRFEGVSVPITQLTFDDVLAISDSPGVVVTELSLDELLARHIERVDVQDLRSRALIPRYEALRDTLRRLLGAVRVFRLGRVEVRVLILGNDPETGQLAGLETVAVET